MIKETRTYTPPAGHTVVVSILEWAETLNPADKKEFYTGFKYQQAREKSYVAVNKLTIDDLRNGSTIYVWDSEDIRNKCGSDTTYTAYHTRYLQETGITLDTTTETI